ncbi:unnamed protein product [Chironomus riparius]|uniref:Ionotropic receptor n=1 Tax=Chironomus riparius TaxID=315576 RepID=A0A9N9RWJ5_9DIPT|nr:unnamed protein product [Chironomus riparius]
MYTDIDSDGKPKGPLIDLFKAMGSRANFTYNYQIVTTSYDGTKSLQPENNTILTPQIHFQIAPFIFSNYAPETYHFTTLFHEQKISFALTESQPYSSFEKLSLPFDTLTWTFLIIVFVCAFSCILVFGIISSKVQELIFGKDVDTPSLNVVAIFFGISQTKLPFRNFPRIILVTFIMFCLVLRTAYQGVLFEMIAGDLRKPLPKTLDDLHDMDYKILLCDAISFIEDLFPEKLTTSVHQIDMLNFTALLIARKSRLQDKTSFCFYDDYLKTYDRHFPCSGGFLNEQLYSSLGGIILPQFNFLYELVDETLQLLLAAGIFQHSFEMLQFEVHLKLFSISMPLKLVDVEILTLDGLSYGFTLWMFACIISGIAFMLELTGFYLKLHPIDRLKDLIGVFIISRFSLRYNVYRV